MVKLIDIRRAIVTVNCDYDRKPKQRLSAAAMAIENSAIITPIGG